MSTVERGTIYTPGVSQPKAVTRLEQLMRHPHMLVVDVRSQPISRWNRQWDRAALIARYGEQYRWERRLGNMNYWNSTQPVQLPTVWQEAVHDAAALLCVGASLVLLCACHDERTCQRSSIARLIQDALPMPVTAREVLA